MSAEWARAAACSFAARRSGRMPCATRTRFMAPMIRLSEVLEKTAAEAAEIVDSAMTNAAQSAATCVGERIARHSEAEEQAVPSPKRGIRQQESAAIESFARARSPRGRRRH